MVIPPKRGQIIKLNFNPQKGSEQAAYRPAVILSRTAYNKKTGMCLACPITRSAKGYSTELALSNQLITKGVVLTSQIKALDWRVRPFSFIETVDDKFLDEILDRLIAIIE